MWIDLEEKFYMPSNEEIQSELAVPILLDGEVLGVINVESRTPDFYTVEHEKFLKIVAQLIARTLDSLMVRDGFQKPLTNIFDKIRGKFHELPFNIPIENNSILNDVSSIVAKSLKSGSCTIWLLDRSKEELILRGAYGPHREYINQHREKHGETIAWRAITQRCLLRYGPNYPRDRDSGRYDVEVYGETLETPFIIAPLLAHSDAIGVIKVGLKRATRDNPQGNYTGVDEQILYIIQGQIASAIELHRLEMAKVEQSLQRFRELSNLHEIFTELDLKTVLQKAVEKAPELCYGLYCSIFLWDEARKVFVLAASNGLPDKMIGKASYLPGEGLTGWVGLYGQPLVLDSRASGNLKKIHPSLTWKSKYNEASLSQDSDQRPFLAVPIFTDQNIES
jgi:signal transduction protein with GAF and PtsI domain